jgi:hypothetical protein
MTPRQFDSLDEMDKIKAIGYHAEKLTSREDEYFHYNLYQLDSFYIEEKIEKVPGGNSFFSPSHFSTKVEITLYLQKIKTSQ